VVRRVIFSDDDDRIVELRWKVSGGGISENKAGKHRERTKWEESTSDRRYIHVLLNDAVQKSRPFISKNTTQQHVLYGRTTVRAYHTYLR
jgi:hypothetical protein